MKKIQIIIIVSLTLLFQGCIGWLVGDPRPYKCNIGCGDNMITPPQGYYVDENGKIKK